MAHDNRKLSPHTVSKDSKVEKAFGEMTGQSNAYECGGKMTTVTHEEAKTIRGNKG